MQLDNRRAFIKKSVAIGGTSLVAAPAIAGSLLGANERIRVGLVGMGKRMKYHVDALAQLAGENVEIVAICDCDENKLQSAEKRFPQLAGKKLVRYADQRELLDNPSIDAVSFATQDHWHALQTIWACQAGKHVYIEKPGSHNIAEGRKMVEAARKYRRMVQLGTQCRSSPRIVEAIGRLKEGVIGDVYMARGISYKHRGDMGKHGPSPVPQGLNWDAWIGPANMVEYNDFIPSHWYWLANFGSGDVANQLVHQADIIRWGLALDAHPDTVQAMAGRYLVDDDADTPNTGVFSCQWAGRNILVTFEFRHWHTPSEADLGIQYPFLTPNQPVGTIFFGSKGYMILPDYSSYYTFLGPHREPGPNAAEPGHEHSELPHFRNWIAAIRSDKREDLAADIEQGHLSTSICHLAKVSYTLGCSVHFDPKSERFIGDPEADKLLSRKYREPYIFPECPGPACVKKVRKGGSYELTE